MPERLRALIVDDEAGAREELRDLLVAHPEVVVVGEAENASDAIEAYRRFTPDLIFLDVQMPRGDGFSLLPALQPVPAIIFVTAYDAYAVKAFEVNAVDYLLKPIDPTRLALALSLVRQPRRPGEPIEANGRVFLYSDHELRVVPVGDVTCIEAEADYTRVHLAHHPPMFVRRGISQWEGMLPRPMFLRVDRSLLVNLEAVIHMVAKHADRITLEISGRAEPIQLGRSASRRLRRALSEPWLPGIGLT